MQPCTQQHRDTCVVNIFIYLLFMSVIFITCVIEYYHIASELLVRTSPILVQEKYLIRFVQVLLY